MNASANNQQDRRAFIAGLVFFVLALLALAWGGWQLKQYVEQQKTTPIAQVRLFGDFRHIEPTRLQQRLHDQYVGNIFRVDVAEVQQFLLQQPWVYQVAVRKQWPDTLVVVVTEQQPVAIWNDQQLINQHGELFTAPLDQLIAVLPELTGPTGSEQDALSMFRYIEQLLSLHQLSAERLELTERFAWQIQLSNDIRLKLGRQHTVPRVQRFLELYPVLREHSDAAIAEVDLRYDTGVAVRYSTTEQKREA
ncbi:cell division protein FtsQ/DivIB [Alkalimonas sp. MEB108]|uniref:Cell division protein FtsQ n=1 Tax=Alkalimonas cellulosilytica TaxID=3058395 RepID=A0ABU7J494_9GAMM|nr:cell division protein FtsQ/DivIB [Alkalimonas sp. MEB108]MEE2000862.1 cell division protein FtsQ/DivIB [Alkalimonas sp. MEB108]